MKYTSKIQNVSSKGQIVLPKTMRKKYGIEQNSKILVEDTNKGILIKKIDIDDVLNSMIGSLKTKLTTQEIKDQIRSEERKHEIRKYGTSSI